MSDNVTLIVQDHPDDGRLVARAIRQPGCEIDITAAAGDVDLLEYLHAAARGDGPPIPRLILLNLPAPRRDALELIRRIRVAAPGRLPPVVLLVPDADAEFRTAAYSLGANSCVRRPVDPAELSEMVRQIGRYWITLNVLPEGFIVA